MVAVGRHRGGQVGGAVVGQAGGGPSAVLVNRRHDLRAVHQGVLLLRGDLLPGILGFQLLVQPHPGRRGKVAGARDVHVAVAVAGKAVGAGNRTGGLVAAAVPGAEMGPAVVDAGAAAVADVGQQLPVVADLGEGGGVGVGLEDRRPGILRIVQAEQGRAGLGVAPGAGVLIQVVPALESNGGGGHVQAVCGRRVLEALDGQPGAGAVPVFLNGVPAIVSPVL